MLLSLGSPLPDDAVAAVRGESGMLGGLSVPLSWGVAVPPDDYDHWAKEPETAANGVGADSTSRPAAGDEWDEWAQWSEWQESAEPRFELPRTTSVIPHSPPGG
ncbi:hypothetical protein [Mycobacterium sp. 1164966.3]|uniref:hypothetical protein n=1 Tax=Mycobacterium sp. 1164966.3 TaxID=1856861 RepID=UPI00352CB525